MGVINTIFTLISPMIMYYVPAAEKEAGLIAATIVAASMFSPLLMILVLRHHRQLKLMAIFSSGMAALCVIVFVIGLLTGSRLCLYSAAVLLGVFVTAFQTIGYECAFEMTFPESDSTVGGVLNVSAQMFSILTTTLVTATYSAISHLAGNMLLIAILLIGLCCLTFSHCEQRRYSAYHMIDTAAKHLGSLERLATTSGERTPLLQRAVSC